MDPFAMCVSDGDLWITDCGNNRIQIFDSNFRAIRTVPLGEYQPLGICLSLKGRILVSTSQNVILILDQDGNIIKKFGSDGNGQFGWSRGICCNMKNEVLLADYKNSRIQIFSQSGQFLETVENLSPRGICVDGNDNLILLDHEKGKILVFDSNRVLREEINFSKPLDLCLLGKRLFVTSKDGLVGVFSN